MKFFTRAWCSGEYSDEKSDSLVADYYRHLDEIAPKLSPDLLTVAYNVSLHDAQFKAIYLDQAEHQLTIRLRCGELQTGYFDLLLRYDSVLCDTDMELESLVERKGVEVLYAEMDIADDSQFEHRIILWPEGEITIRFTQFEFSRTAVHSRNAP